MRICVAQLKSLRKSQKKNSMDVDDTAAATAPIGGSAPDTAETGGAVEEPNLRTATAEQIECLPLSQPTVPSHPPSN